MKHCIQVVGMGMCRADLSQKHLEVIREAQVLVGTQRHLQWFPDHPADRREIDSPMSAVLEDIEKLAQSCRVVVMASGDPLFFGIGSTLIKRFGPQNVEIHSNISSMAAAFSRIGRSWQDARAVSMHARNSKSGLKAALASGKPVFVLTDPENTPDQVARTVYNSYCWEFDFRVFECLGMENERIRKLSLAHAVQENYLQPNAVILEPAEQENKQLRENRLLPGLPEENYAHDPGMITRAEVRAVALSKLRLQSDHLFWDLGAASGSVAVEAAFFITSGRIIAVEKNARRAQHIRENAETYAPGKIEVVEKLMPAAIDELPEPDRVFIGGGGNDIAEIVRNAASRLRPGGRIVANIVVLETLNQCLAVLEEQDFAVETVQVQVSRSSPMPGGQRLSAENPVFVVSAEKPV